MPFAINLCLDEPSSLAVDGALAQLASLGVADRDMIIQYGACVTLLVVDDTIRADRLSDLLRRAVVGIGEVEVELGGPRLYPSMPPSIGLSVSAADSLLAAHDRLFRELPVDSVDMRNAPAHWQPHVRLANARGRDSDRRRLLNSLGETWKKRTARLDHLELIRYMPVQPVWRAPLAATHGAGPRPVVS